MIFNKANNGTNELFAATGTYARSNDFSVIRTEVESACTAVRELIGKELFKRGEDHYNSTSYDAGADNVDTRLVRKIQTAVAMLAMFRYYQQMLSHEDGGRKLKLNDSADLLPDWTASERGRVDKAAAYGYKSDQQTIKPDGQIELNVTYICEYSNFNADKHVVTPVLTDANSVDVAELTQPEE